MKNDPICAAIERHRAIYAALQPACIAADDIAAKQAGRSVTEADKAALLAADNAEVEPLDALSETKPTTVAGVHAVLEYLGNLADGCGGSIPAWHLNGVLGSPVFAA